MDKLKMGDVTLQGSVHFTTARVAEQSVPALELRVEGPVDEAVLEAVKAGKLEIYGEDSILQGTQIGYNTVMRHSIVIAKVSDAQQQLAEAKAQLEALQAEKDALECEHAALLYASLTGEVL